MQLHVIGLVSVMLVALASVPAPAPAQPGIQQKTVQFKKGETGATLKGTLKGDEIIDYKLRASAGQSMVVQFKPSNPSAYFNVMAPGKDEAMFIGSTSGNELSADLAASGEYTIRVYLMRNAARRNETVKYTLEVAVVGDAKKPVASAAPAPAAVTNAGPAKWDASGYVKCSAGSDKFDKQCGFRVVRDRPREAADIWIGNIANGEADYRHLRYENKSFRTNDSSKPSWQRRDDNWSVNVGGKEFYLVPDALIHGG